MHRIRKYGCLLISDPAGYHIIYSVYLRGLELFEEHSSQIAPEFCIEDMCGLYIEAGGLFEALQGESLRHLPSALTIKFARMTGVIFSSNARLISSTGMDGSCPTFSAVFLIDISLLEAVFHLLPSSSRIKPRPSND